MFEEGFAFQSAHHARAYARDDVDRHRDIQHVVRKSEVAKSGYVVRLQEDGDDRDDDDGDHPSREPFEGFRLAFVIDKVRIREIEALFFAQILAVDEGALRLFLYPASVGVDERHEHEIGDDEREQTHLYAREHRYAHEVLRYAHSKGVHHARREAETGREHGYAEPHERVPAEGVREQHHHGDEGDELLEHARRRA